MIPKSSVSEGDMVFYWAEKLKVAEPYRRRNSRKTRKIAPNYRCHLYPTENSVQTKVQTSPEKRKSIDFEFLELVDSPEQR